MSIAARPYAGDADYARMRAMLTASYAASGPPVYCTVGDLDWWRYTDDDPAAIASARLWCASSGEVVGVAWPSGGQVDLLVHPRHRALEEELLAWAEDRRRDEGAAAGAREPTTLTASAYEGDRARQAVLRRRGYERLAGEGGFSFNTRALDGAPPVPRLPEGYTLRHVAGEADLERRVAVHRDAFAPSRMTVAKHRAVMAAPTYRPALDLVAVAPDESFAAFCIVWFDEANRHGVFEPVGCHSAHRRRGLGRAIVAEGLRRLAALDARTASVCSVVEGVAANGLYAAAGFAPLDCSRAWRKTL